MLRRCVNGSVSVSVSASVISASVISVTSVNVINGTREYQGRPLCQSMDGSMDWWMDGAN